MARRVTPMIHVPDVAATLAWYRSIGFEFLRSNEDDQGKIDWALLSFGDGRLMLTAGGKVAASDRREVDLYLNVDHVAELFETVKGRLEIRQGLYDTFYGMREFIVRDPNGFWVTFGEPIEAPG